MTIASLSDIASTSNAGDSTSSFPPAVKKPVYQIASIPGDGIGPEVVGAAITVLKALAKKRGTFKLEFTDFDWSSETYKKTGRYVPENHLEILKGFDAIL